MDRQKRVERLERPWRLVLPERLERLDREERVDRLGRPELLELPERLGE